MKNISKIVESIINKKAEQFKTRLIKDTNFDVYNLNKWEKVTKGSEQIFDSAELIVSWNFDIDMRDWGIKGITTTIANVVGTIMTIVTTATDNDKEEEMEYEFDAVKDGFEIVSELKFVNDTLVPTNIEIDFVKKKVVVS